MSKMRKWKTKTIAKAVTLPSEENPTFVSHTLEAEEGKSAEAEGKETIHLCRKY